MREDLSRQTELCISVLVSSHTTPAFNSRQEICWILETDMEMSHAQLNRARSQVVELKSGLLLLLLQLECEMAGRQSVR